jgi:hypothetical protein
MAQALVTATRMNAQGECSTVMVRLNKRAKTATHEGCVYKQLFVHAKYEVSAYVVQDVEKLASLERVVEAGLLEVAVPIVLTSKLLIAPLLWVHAHPPQNCDALFLKAVWERASQEHTYPPLRLSKDTSLLRATPPMLRLHLSPHGAVIASTACQVQRPQEKAKAGGSGAKAKKKCVQKKKRRDEDDENDEEEACKAEESEEIEDDESEEKEDGEAYDDVEEEDAEEDEVEDADEDEEEDDDNEEDGEEQDDEEEEEIDDEEAEESEVDDTLKSEDEEEERKVEKGRTTKRTKS